MDSRYDQETNQLVLRSENAHFYLINDISVDPSMQQSEVKMFYLDEYLEEKFGDMGYQIDDYILIPANVSGS